MPMMTASSRMQWPVTPATSFSASGSRVLRSATSSAPRNRQEVLALDDGHVFHRRRRARGAAAEGGDVAEVVEVVGSVVLEHVKHLFGGHAARNGGVAGGHAFGHGHDVGLDAVMLVAEPCAGAADAADDFVDVQQHIPRS